MTNKELIDYCNEFKGKCHRDCPYIHTYCDAFIDKTGLTSPFLENKFHPEVYTDEEIEYENRTGNQRPY